MSKLFLATSFSGHTNKSGEVNPEHRTNVEGVLDGLRELGGFTVYCAVEQEGWVVSNEPPGVGVKDDLEAIQEYDVFLALLPQQPLVSAGLQYELCEAYHAGKTVLVATQKNEHPGYYNTGLADNNRITLIEYVDPVDLARQVVLEALMPPHNTRSQSFPPLPHTES